jgi:hypothetical protein
MKFAENTFEPPLKKFFTFLVGLQLNRKNLHATMKTLGCQQSRTSLQHPMGRVLVMGLVAH